MDDAESPDRIEWLKALLHDESHPKGSPLLGLILSRTVCAVGHDVVEMEIEAWDQPWLACPCCGARFLPVDAMADDYDVVKV